VVVDVEETTLLPKLPVIPAEIGTEFPVKGFAKDEFGAINPLAISGPKAWFVAAFLLDKMCASLSTRVLFLLVFEGDSSSVSTESVIEEI
jgi:hypothetical protein